MTFELRPLFSRSLSQDQGFGRIASIPLLSNFDPGSLWNGLEPSLVDLPDSARIGVAPPPVPLPSRATAISPIAIPGIRPPISHLEAESEPAIVGPVSPIALEIYETAERHAGVEDAQPLPDAKVVTLRGSLAPSDRADMYRLDLRPNTRNLRLELDWNPNAPGPPGRLLVLDRRGKDLIGIPLGFPASSSTVQILGLDQDQTPYLYVGIAPGDDAKALESPSFDRGSASVSDYELNLLQEDQTDVPSPLADLNKPDSPETNVPAPTTPAPAGTSPEDQTTPSIDGGGSEGEAPLPVASPAPPDPNSTVKPTATGDDPATLPNPIPTPSVEVPSLIGKIAPPVATPSDLLDRLPAGTSYDEARVDLRLIDVEGAGRPIWLAVMRSVPAPIAAPAETDAEAMLAAITEAAIVQALMASGSAARPPMIVFPAPETVPSGGVPSEDVRTAILPAIVDFGSIDFPIASTSEAATGAEGIPLGEGAASRVGRRLSFLTGIYGAATLVLATFSPDLIPIFRVLKSSPRRPRQAAGRDRASVDV